MLAYFFQRSVLTTGSTIYFLEQYNKKYNKLVKGISKSVEEIFLSYEWPGNVRELKNVVERAVILTQRELIGCEVLPETLLDTDSSFNKLTKEELENILSCNNHNISRTARELKISRNTLYKRLRQLGIK